MSNLNIYNHHLTTKENMKKSGIYAIVNIENWKVYIGQSVCIKTRWTKHKRYLTTNTHNNKHLQSSYNFYGESSFIFIILEIVGINNLTEREQYYMDKAQCYRKDKGYNKAMCAEKSQLGLKHSVTQRYKRSRLLGRNIFCVETRQMFYSISECSSYFENVLTVQQILLSTKDNKPTRLGLTFRYIEKNWSFTKTTHITSRNHRKPIYCVENKKTYQAKVDASKDLNIASVTIRQSIKKGVSVKGYTFYELDAKGNKVIVEPELIDKTPLTTEGILCLSDFKRFKSIEDARDYYSISTHTIRRNINQNKKLKCGLYFKKIDVFLFVHIETGTKYKSIADYSKRSNNSLDKLKVGKILNGALTVDNYTFKYLKGNDIYH